MDSRSKYIAGDKNLFCYPYLKQFFTRRSPTSMIIFTLTEVHTISRGELRHRVIKQFVLRHTGDLCTEQQIKCKDPKS